MPFRKGKSVKQAVRDIRRAIPDSLREQVVRDFATFLNPEELRKITVDVDLGGNVAVNGDNAVLEKIKRHRRNN